METNFTHPNYKYQKPMTKKWNDLNDVIWENGTWDCHGRRILIEDQDYEGINEKILFSPKKPYEDADFILLSKDDAKDILSICNEGACSLLKNRGVDSIIINDNAMNNIVNAFGERAAALERVNDALTGKRYYCVRDAETNKVIEPGTEEFENKSKDWNAY